MNGSTRARWAALILGAAVCGLFFGCGGGGSPAVNSTPIITALNPAQITAGSQLFTLTVTGAGFVTGSQAFWNGSMRTTSFSVSTGQLAVSILDADVANPGIGLVTVMNPAPGGGLSAAASFTINAQQAGGPLIAAANPFTPASANAGTVGPFMLTVNGSNFLSGSNVSWNGAFRTTTFVSSTMLTASLTTEDLALPGSGSVAVDNPAADGGFISSPSVNFPINGAASAKPAFPMVVSVNSLGGPSNGRSALPAISEGGRFVAFTSRATNLTPLGGAAHVFVRDTCLGAANCAPATFPVDLSPSGGAPNGPAVGGVGISGDGRFVVFASLATNLLEGNAAPPSPASAPQVLLRDTCLGATAPANCRPRTELISAAADSPTLSADGRFLAFRAGFDAAGAAETILVRDTCAGAPAASGCAPRTVALPDADAEARPASKSSPSISSGGRFVVFVSGASAKDAGAIALADSCLGAAAPVGCTPRTIVIGAAPNSSVAFSEAGNPSVSGDGRFVVFRAGRVVLPSSQTSRPGQILLADTCLGPSAGAGCSPAVSIVSSDGSGNPGNGESAAPRITGSGRFIVFSSFATNLVSDSALRSPQIFVRDTCFGAAPAEGCIPKTAAVANSSAADPRTGPALDAGSAVSISAGGELIGFFSLTWPGSWPGNGLGASSGASSGRALPLSGLGDVLLTDTPFAPAPKAPARIFP